MKMISYAQNFEDVLLNRLFDEGYHGFYIDVGANHPWLHSVTKHFYDRGWSGVNVEPVACIHAMLEAERPRDVNLNIGLSNRETVLTLYEPETSLGMSSFSPSFVEGLKHHGYEGATREVPVTTLAALCERHVGSRTIDFLKIDVEGHETEVIHGADWQRWRPRVVLVEATEPHRWEPRLLESGYHFANFDGLNRYFIRHEDRDLAGRLATPANVLDDFAPFEYLRPIHELRHSLEQTRAALEAARAECAQAKARLAPLDQVGPTTLAVARRLQRVAVRFPRLKATARRLLRPAG